MTELERLQQIVADLNANKDAQFAAKNIADARIVQIDQDLISVNNAIASLPPSP
jgi:hypothetical protein